MALLFLLPRLWMGVGCQRHAPAALPRERDTVPIVQEAEWATGSVWTVAKNLAPTGIRSPDRQVRSESVYRIRCPGPLGTLYSVKLGLCEFYLYLQKSSFFFFRVLRRRCFVTVCTRICRYRVSREECARLRENVPYVKVHRSNPRHVYPKLNGYGDNGERKVWSSCCSTYCTCFACCYPYTAHVRPSVLQPS